MNHKIITHPSEPFFLWFLKLSLYMISFALYLGFLTDVRAMYVAVICSMIAVMLTIMLNQSTWTILGIGMVSIGGFLIAFLSGKALESFTFFSNAFSPEFALTLSEVFYCGFSAFSLTLFLRFWGQRSSIGALVESFFALGAVILLFASHREGQIHEPRFFADWALINGYDIPNLLTTFGFIVVGIAFILLMKLRSNWQFILALLTLIFLVYGVSLLNLEKTATKKSEVLGFDGASGDDDGNSNDNNNDNNNNNNNQTSSSKKPDLVAIAILHEDYESNTYYFRQQVLSFFDGTKLVSDPLGQRDKDVITQFPLDKAIYAENTQDENSNIPLLTSMYLITEHATPPSIGQSIQLAPLENTNPNRFLKVYDVESMIPTVTFNRLSGSPSIPRTWNEEKKNYYLKTPDDPRYKALSNEIVRELSPSLQNDDMAKAFAIKRYLEQNGYYTLKKKISSDKDPVAPFLFGDMKGYCVHFAHAAVHLLRSQGIAARVALGYAVDNQYRSQSSSVLIMSDRAHAWPEIHVVGVGWITFDIYPENSDPIPQQMVSQSLESLFGEIARKQEQRGLKKAFEIPWLAMKRYTLATIISLLILLYFFMLRRAFKTYFSADEHQGKWAYIQILDRLSAIGIRRHEGESREAFARRLISLSQSFDLLTTYHLSAQWADPSLREKTGIAAKELRAIVFKEFAQSLGWKWYLGFFNPLTTYLSR
jgi:hypothetical protein